MLKIIWLAGFGVLFGAQAALADDYSRDGGSEQRPSTYSYAWSEPSMYSLIGIGVTVGGGIAGFTSQAMRDNTNTQVSGLWTARATFGTHTPIGLEVGYNGTAVKLAPDAATTTGNLVGTNVEAALRYNILPHYSWNPYVFAGVGMQRYNITGADFSQADTGFKDKDNLAVFPMGVGIGYRDRSGFVADVRGTFRAAQSSTLLREPSGQTADLHTWDAGGNLGYEF